MCSEAASPAALSLWNHSSLWCHRCTSLLKRHVRGSSLQLRGHASFGSRMLAAWWLAASCDIMLLICSWTWRTCMKYCTRSGVPQVMAHRAFRTEQDQQGQSPMQILAMALHAAGLGLPEASAAKTCAVITWHEKPKCRSPEVACFMAVADIICILNTVTPADGRPQSASPCAPPARHGGWWAAEALQAEAVGSGLHAVGAATGPGLR